MVLITTVLKNAITIVGGVHVIAQIVCLGAVLVIQYGWRRSAPAGAVRAELRMLMAAALRGVMVALLHISARCNLQNKKPPTIAGGFLV